MPWHATNVHCVLNSLAGLLSSSAPLFARRPESCETNDALEEERSRNEKPGDSHDKVFIMTRSSTIEIALTSAAAIRNWITRPGVPHKSAMSGSRRGTSISGGNLLYATLLVSPWHPALGRFRGGQL